MVHEIDVLFNMIKEQQYHMNLMKNQLESQSELISSLQKQLEFITPKGRPQVDTPKGRPQVDTPKGRPQVDTPKGRPQVDTPKGRPQVDTPKGRPQVDTPKGRPQVDIQAEVDMLLSDEYWSDSKTSNGISTESIDDPFIASKTSEITCNETKKEERKSSFRTSSPHPILNKGPVRILKYSEKAFVVIGDTKKNSTTLNKMGGKWNISLTYKETGEKFMGWVFSNRQLDKVSMWIDLGCL
jgi:hypothetical protein